MRWIATALLICLFPLLPAPAEAAAADSGQLLARTLTLNLWGVSLTETARAIQEQTGVEVVFYLPDFPPDKNVNSVFLVTGQVSLRTVLECLARRHGFRYRLGDAGRVEVSRSYGWVRADDYSVRFIRLDPLLPDTTADLAELRKFLGEFAKPLPLLTGDYSLALARSPARENRISTRAEAVMPPVLAEYFEKAVQCLAGEAGDVQYGAGAATAAGQRFAFHERVDWEKLLTRDLQVPRSGDLRTDLKDLCDQARIAIALSDAPPAGVGAPLSSLPSETATLGAMSSLLGERLAMGRRVFLDSGAMVFESAGKAEWENDHRSREFFWNGLSVAGFDAAEAAQKAGGGKNLVRLIKREVFPGLWQDPVAAIGYSGATGRLAVIAPANVIEAVAARLAIAARDPAPAGFL